MRVTKNTIFLLILLTLFQAPQTRAQGDKEKKIEELWEEVKHQRNLLEQKSQDLGLPLREILPKDKFLDSYPLLPQNKQLESAPLIKGVEIRIATIPDNITREGKPYCLVALIYHNKKGNIEIKMEPDGEEYKRLLNLIGSWENSRRVDNPPKIVTK
jgi:hypothetical protein